MDYVIVGQQVQTENGRGTVIDFDPKGIWVHILPKDMLTPETSMYYQTNKDGNRVEKQMRGLYKLFEHDQVRVLSTAEMIEAL